MLLHNLCNKNNALLDVFIIVQVSVCVEVYVAGFAVGLYSSEGKQR